MFISLLSHLLSPTTHKITPFRCSQPDHLFPLLINEFYCSFSDVELYYWYHCYCILIPLPMYHFTLNCYIVSCPSYSSPALLQSHESILFKYYCPNNSSLLQEHLNCPHSLYFTFLSHLAVYNGFFLLSSCSHAFKSLVLRVCICA